MLALNPLMQSCPALGLSCAARRDNLCRRCLSHAWCVARTCDLASSVDWILVQEVMDYASEEEQGGDPPRIWAPGANFPGTAFTRSLGDSGGCCSITAA